MEPSKVSNHIYQMQCALIGTRYAGATLSRAKLLRDDAEKVFKWLNELKGILLLMGVPGCGKTYLSAAILSWISEKTNDVYFIEEEIFFRRLRDSMDCGDYSREIEMLCDHEFLIYDDLGSSGQGGQSGWRQEVLFAMVNNRYVSEKPTVLTTNFTKEEISQKLGARTGTRIFDSGHCIIDMHGYPNLRNLIRT